MVFKFVSFVRFRNQDSVSSISTWSLQVLHINASVLSLTCSKTFCVYFNRLLQSSSIPSMKDQDITILIIWSTASDFTLPPPPLQTFVNMLCKSSSWYLSSTVITIKVSWRIGRLQLLLILSKNVLSGANTSICKRGIRGTALLSHVYCLLDRIDVCHISQRLLLNYVFHHIFQQRLGLQS